MLSYFWRLIGMSIIYNLKVRNFFEIFWPLSNSVSLTWKPDNPYCHIVRNRQGIDGKKFVQMPFPLVLLADAKMQRRKTTTHFRTSSRLRNRPYVMSEKWLDGWVGSRKASFSDVQYCIYADIVGELVKKVKNNADVVHQHEWSLTQT